MNAHDGHPNYEADNCPRCGTAQARMGVADLSTTRDDQCAVHLSAMCSHEWGMGDGFESFQAAGGGPVTTNIDGAEVVRGCDAAIAYATELGTDLMYAITAQIQFRGADGWDRSRQVPTFYLHKNVQGIVTEAHARQIAEDVITASVPDRTTVRCFITAVEVPR